MPYTLPTPAHNSLLSTPIKRIILFLSLSFALAFLIRFTRTPFFGPLDVKLFYLINAGIKNPFFDFILPFFSLNWVILVLVGIFFIYLFVSKGVKISLALLAASILILPVGGLLKKTANLNRPYASLSDPECSYSRSTSSGCRSDTSKNSYIRHVYYYDYSGQWILIKQPTQSSENTHTSFPSGHALRFFVLAGFLWKNRKIRSFLLVIGALLILSRIYLGAHYPSDALIGAFIGAYFGFLVHKIAIL